MDTVVVISFCVVLLVILIMAISLLTPLAVGAWFEVLDMINERKKGRYVD